MFQNVQFKSRMLSVIACILIVTPSKRGVIVQFNCVENDSL